MGDATMVEVFNFLSDNKSNGYKLTDFRSEWVKLTDQDKVDLKKGVGDGTLNY